MPQAGPENSHFAFIGPALHSSLARAHTGYNASSHAPACTRPGQRPIASASLEDRHACPFASSIVPPCSWACRACGSCTQSSGRELEAVGVRLQAWAQLPSNGAGWERPAGASTHQNSAAAGRRLHVADAPVTPPGGASAACLSAAGGHAYSPWSGAASGRPWLGAPGLGSAAGATLAAVVWRRTLTPSAPLRAWGRRRLAVGGGVGVLLGVCGVRPRTGGCCRRCGARRGLRLLCGGRLRQHLADLDRLRAALQASTQPGCEVAVHKHDPDPAQISR